MKRDPDVILATREQKLIDSHSICSKLLINRAEYGDFSLDVSVSNQYVDRFSYERTEAAK